METHYTFEVSITGVSKDDWLDWCETEDDRISGPGADYDTETLHVEAASLEEAREYLAAHMPPGMFVRREGEMTMSITTQTCQRCGHHWLPRAEGRPVQCPGCKSQRWDRPRKEATA